MTEYSKKYKPHNKDFDRSKKRDYSQDFEYKRKQGTGSPEEYVEKNPKPTNAEPVEPEMKEAEPESRHDFQKKKKGSGFGFNSTFGSRTGKFGGQEKWANDKKANDEDEREEGAPIPAPAGEYGKKNKYGAQKGGYRKESLTYYERKQTNETKVEPDYYKSTNFDLPKEPTATTRTTASINWNTQNKRRQDTESDDYEDEQEYHGEQYADYNQKQSYKQNYKQHDSRRGQDYSYKNRDQHYQEYPEGDKSYKTKGYQSDYSYNEKKNENYKYDAEKNYKGSYPGKAYQGGKYGGQNYRQEEYDYADKNYEAPKVSSSQQSAPERRMGGREFKLPPEDSKKVEGSRYFV